ncbi:MAG: DUF1854 domain-containing protein [Actinomycetota bacterium]
MLNQPNPPIDPRSLHLFHHPPGTLRLTVSDNHSYAEVKLYQAWPLSAPRRFLSLVNSKGDEIAMVEDLDALGPASRAVAEEELRRRYLTAKVQFVREIRTEFGVTYWHVSTDKGERDFVVQSMSESCVWLTDRHLLIIDVDGNRFELEDLTTYDAVSKGHLSTVL